MREVSVTLRFMTPCLGNERGDRCDRFLRDPATDKPIFMNSWWQRLLEFGAQGLSKYQDAVKNVFFDLYVDGTVKPYKRYYRSDAYKVHEAFLEGDSITIRAKLPDELTADGLREVLEAAGRWRGFSPYGWKKGFGRFSVVEVNDGTGSD